MHAMRRRKSENARTKLVRSAEKIVYRQGYNSTGVADILKDADCAIMSLYRNFRSKDDLILEALSDRDTRWMQWFAAATQRNATKRQQPRSIAMFDALGEWFASSDFRGCAFINLAAEIADRSHPLRRLAEDHKRKLFAFVETIAKTECPNDSKVVADGLFLLMEGAIVTSLIRGDPRVAAQAKAAAKCLYQRRPKRDTLRAG